jgi:hypothetical protein
MTGYAPKFPRNIRTVPSGNIAVHTAWTTTWDKNPERKGFECGSMNPITTTSNAPAAGDLT